ncbi:MAG: hypothetical protein ACTHLZ_05320 [Tepidisphaeraceae bacterium]
MGLELVELMMDVEQEFGINIPDADAELLTNLALLTDYVQKASAKMGRPLDHARTARRLRELLLEITGMNELYVHDEADFVRDLGIDARCDIARAVRKKQIDRPPEELL